MKTFAKSLLALSAAVLLVTSCIDRDYDLNKLSGTIAIGGDSLSLPLARTDSITLAALLDSGLMVGPDGYCIAMSDTFHADIAELSGVSIPDVDFSPDPISKTFVDASMAEITVDGLRIKEDFDLGFGGSLDLELPSLSVSEIQTFDASLWYMSDEMRRLDDQLLQMACGTIMGSATLPDELQAMEGMLPHTEIPLLLPSNTVSLNAAETIDMVITAPDGINSVDGVTLSNSPKPATFTLTLSLENADDFLTGGSLIPDFGILPTQIFGLVGSDLDSDGRILFHSGDALTKANHYSVSKRFNIDNLNISGEPSNGKLNISDLARVNGNVSVEGITFYADEINKVRSLGLKVDIAINDMVIESIHFTTSKELARFSNQSPISVQTRLPDMVASVDRIDLANPSTLKIHLVGDPALNGLDGKLIIKDLSINFPTNLQFDPAEGLDLSTNTYRLTDFLFHPQSGLDIELNMTSIDMSALSVIDGLLTWEDQIAYSGTFLVEGELDSRDLPTGRVECGMNITSALQLDAVYLSTETHNVDLPSKVIPIAFDIATSDMIGEIKSAKVKPGSYLTIRPKLPDFPLPITAEMSLQLPSIVVFKEHPNLDANNVFTISGSVPSEIALEIEGLEINQAMQNGVLSIQDQASISGTLTVSGGNLNSQDLENISQASFEMVLDDMSLADIVAEIEGIKIDFSDAVEFNESVELPEQILDVDSLLFTSKAQLEFNLTVNNLPSFDSPVNLDFRLKLPSFIVSKSPAVDEMNYWHFSSVLENGKPVKQVLPLYALDFSDREVNGTLELKESLNYSLQVSINSSTLHSEDFSSDPVEISPRVKLSGMEIEKAYCRLGASVESFNTTMQINLPPRLKDSNIALNINHFGTIETKTNLPVGIRMDGNMVPYSRGIAQTDIRQDFVVTLNAPEDPYHEAVNRFWLAKDNFGMPDEYTLVSLGIGDLIGTTTDSICLTADVALLDKSCLIDLTIPYYADIFYDVNVPIIFSPNAELVLRDTIRLEADNSEIGSHQEGSLELGQIVEMVGNSVEVFGEVENSIPLNIEASLIAVDGDLKPIASIEPFTTDIAAGKTDGSITISPLSLRINSQNTDDFNHLAGFILEFRARGDASLSTTPLKPEQFVRATLGLRLLGGLIVDFKDLSTTK